LGVYGELSLTQKVFGRITNYRTGIKAQYPKECLIQIDNVTSASIAGKMLGQKVAWTNGTAKDTGKIVGAHGKNGMVRVRFVKGVPGQAVGSIVEVVA
jgi:large subunit ribosomal protein L35Ae